MIEEFMVIIRMSLEDATAFATGKGYSIRVTNQDGEALIVSQEEDRNRINVWTIDGKVSSIDSIG